MWNFDFLVTKILQEESAKLSLESCDMQDLCPLYSYLEMLGVSHTRYYEILGYYQILVSSHYERLWETELKL